MLNLLILLFSFSYINFNFLRLTNASTLPTYLNLDMSYQEYLKFKYVGNVRIIKSLSG